MSTNFTELSSLCTLSHFILIATLSHPDFIGSNIFIGNMYLVQNQRTCYMLGHLIPTWRCVAKVINHWR